MKNNKVLSAIIAAAMIATSAAAVYANAADQTDSEADQPVACASETYPDTAGTDAPMKLAQPKMRSQELWDFMDSGEGTRRICIALTQSADNSIFNDAAALADEEMQGMDIPDENRYNEYRNNIIREYVLSHTAEIKEEIKGTFTQRHEFNVISTDTEAMKLTAEVTPDMLKAVLDDDVVIAVIPGETETAVTPDETETEEPIKLIQPIVLCDELRAFLNSDEASKVVMIVISQNTDDSLYDEAVAYADAEMEKNKSSMSNEAMYNDYHSAMVQFYIKEHTAEQNLAAINAFAQKYGVTIYSYNENTLHFTTEITPAQLNEMLKDEDILTIALPSDTVSIEPTTVPIIASPTVSAPVVTIGASIKGDANIDGKVTVADSVTVLQYLANQEKYPMTDEAVENADIDGVPGISGSDAISIQRIDAGID